MGERGQLTPYPEPVAATQELAEDRMQIAYPLNRQWYTAKYPQAWLSTRTHGVFSSDNDLVLTASGGMNVTLSAGLAWLHLDRFKGACFANLEPVVIPVDIADGLYTRIDRIVIRYDVIQENIFPAYLRGIPGSNPQPPDIERNENGWELAVWDIRLTPGATAVTQGMLRDLRMDEDLCGIMRDGVTGIPSQSFYDQWYAWFSELEEEVGQKQTEFIGWLTLLRQTNEDDLMSWLTNFKFTSEEEIENWIQAFEANGQQWYTSYTGSFSDLADQWWSTNTTFWESSFNTWFQTLQDTLTTNQAFNLNKRIDDHEALTIASPDGVHGIRFHNKTLEVLIGSEWFPVGGGAVDTSRDWAYMDALDYTWQQYDMLDQTWDERESMEVV